MRINVLQVEELITLVSMHMHAKFVRRGSMINATSDNSFSLNYKEIFPKENLGIAQSVVVRSEQAKYRWKF